MTTQIDRSFVRIAEGPVHCRRVEGRAGARPLCLIHLSPLSSRSMEPLMLALRDAGFTAPLLAPDTLGNGDSCAPSNATPDIAYFADSLRRLLDTLGIEQVDLFGSHTGARIACELALACPTRVNRLVLDGIAEYPAETRALFRERYAPPIRLDDFGAQMNWAFQYIRNQFLFFPWFQQGHAQRLDRGMPSAEFLHRAALDILNAWDTYHLAYGAAFDYPSAARVTALVQPVLLLKTANGSSTINAAADAFANGRNIVARTIAAGDDSLARSIAEFLA